MNLSDLQSVLNREPTLNDAGFGVIHSRRKSREEIETELAKDRAYLLTQVEGCAKICEWLKQVDRINSINWKHSSMGWKDLARRDIGYVSQGMFIAAAIHAGFPYDRMPDQMAAWFGMSNRSYTLLETRKLVRV